MLNKFILATFLTVIAIGTTLIRFPDGAITLAFVAALAAIAILAFRRFTDEKEFVTTVFLVALALRMGLGLLIHVFELREFFGGDAITYDANGVGLVAIWLGHSPPTNELLFSADPTSGAAWGMNYLVGSIYLIFGRNILAAQSFCAVVGAATAPMVFFCSKKIYNNIRVAKVAVFPSFVIWSGQLLKDGLIIFLLVLTMTMVLQLQQKFGYSALLLLVLSLFGILSLRFYIFYMVVVAVVGSFIINSTSSIRSIARNTIILVLVAVSLTYFGVGQRAGIELTTFGNLDRLQISRSDLAGSASSGFGQDVDVSTPEGALAALPIGFAYLMFAPLPWDAANLRQAITIPDVLLWWAMMPLLIVGLVYTIRNRLRNAFPVLLFSLLLTLAYSIFQGNVGTAYRQRAQIQVFLFILIAVGWTVFLERRENNRIRRAATQKRLDSRVRAGV